MRIKTGFYLGAATIEFGLYALLPAALLGLRERWRRGGTVA